MQQVDYITILYMSVPECTKSPGKCTHTHKHSRNDIHVTVSTIKQPTAATLHKDDYHCFLVNLSPSLLNMKQICIHTATRASSAVNDVQQCPDRYQRHHQLST